MLRFVLSKFINNRWLMICLLIGSILSASAASSIPAFSAGVMQRMLIQDLETYQTQSGKFPGSYFLRVNFTRKIEADSKLYYINLFDNMFSGPVAHEIGLPAICSVKELTIDLLKISAFENEDQTAEPKYAKFTALTDMEDHISLVAGRMYSDKKENGVFEAMVTEGAMKELGVALNEEYELIITREEGMEPIKVRVVGVFGVENPQDLYWFRYLGEYAHNFFIDFDLFYNEIFEQAPFLVSQGVWYHAFDYHKIDASRFDEIIDAYERHFRALRVQGVSLLDFPALNMLREYAVRKAQLELALIILFFPFAIILVFFIYMISRMLIQHDENEIAVIKSRGGRLWQIAATYIIQSFIIGTISLVAGPLLSLFICRMLGNANGFLEFVNRSYLPVSLNKDAVLYALCSIILFNVMLLIPLCMAARTSIVRYKQKRSRGTKRPAWKRYYLDILFLGVVGYGRYRYQSMQKLLNFSRIQENDIGIDPLYFMLTTFFILGIGLLCLRIYPLLIRVIYLAGRKKWPPSLYVSLLQTARSEGQEQFIIIYIILTLSLSLFNAISARTINQNIEDKIRFETGSDIAFAAEWKSNEFTPDPFVMTFYPEDQRPKKNAEGIYTYNQAPLQYEEPDFNIYKGLTGVESAAKVFTVPDAKASSSVFSSRGVCLMGIEPYDFGRTAWSRSDLLPYHMNEYMNLLSSSPGACLVSKVLKDKYRLQPGDKITVSWGNRTPLECTVYAFIDHWPGYTPEDPDKPLVVANLSYIHSIRYIEPYEVWLKKIPGTNDQTVFDDMAAKGLVLTEIKSAEQSIIASKNDPLLQGMNGVLTLIFIFTLVIVSIGFAIFWTLSVRKRALLFGILRSMGMSKKSVLMMLVYEQLMVCGIAIVIGILTGIFACVQFVPMLQMVYGITDQIIPLRIVAFESDYIKIYSAFALIIIVGLLFLGRQIARTKIDQVLKLGED